MSAAIDLSSARDLVRWACEDAEEFDSGAEAYFAANPYSFIQEDDLESGHVLVKVAVAEIPDRLCKLASHAIWDLKHALDHATYAAILAVTGAPPIKDTYFPWVSHPNDLNAKLTHRDGKYPAILHDLFRSFEPYPTGDSYTGGDNGFVALNKMANTSKHAIVLSPATRTTLNEFRGSGGLVCLYADSWDGLKKQLTLGLFRKGSDAKMDVKVTGFIEFGEVEALKGHAAGEVLEGFAKAVTWIVDAIEREVTAIIGARP